MWTKTTTEHGLTLTRRLLACGLGGLTIFTATGPACAQNPSSSPAPAGLGTEPAMPPATTAVPAADIPTVLPPPPPNVASPPAAPNYYDQKYQRAFDAVPENPAGIRNRINLLDAVRVSLLRDPRIKLGAEDAVLAEGALQIAGGAFDTRLTGNARHGGEAKPRDPQNIRTQNEELQANKDALRQVTTERQALANGTPVDPNAGGVTIGGQSTADVQFQQQILALIAQQAAMNGQTDLSNQANALNQAAVQRRDQALGKLEDQFRQAIRQAKIIEVDRPIDNAYDLSARKLFRNGVATTAGLTYAQTGNRPGDVPINRSNLFFLLDIPLGRGLGTRDTAAPETAAKYDLEASLLTLRHTVSDSLLNTGLAYWQAVGARERLKLLIRNARISSTLVQLTRELIQGGSLDVARADLAEIQTKESQALFQQSQAELDLVRSVQSLGLSMGLDALEVLDSPLPTETFPPVVSRRELQALNRETAARVALERRADLLSSIQLQKSRKTLLDAARLQLRPQVNFQFKGEMEAVDFGIPTRHLVTAFAGRYAGPGFVASLNLDWAPANNAAKGNLLQQGANSRQSILRTYDLSRTISSNVLVALASLDSSLSQVARADAEANFGREALEAARVKFRLGQITVLDTIQIQERYINALLDVVSARQLYAQSLLQFRFETATLLPSNSGAASLVEREDLTTLPVLPLLRVSPSPAPVTPMANRFGRGQPARPPSPMEKPPEKSLFRKSALERLSSPEQLDTLMQVTSPIGWSALIAMAVLLFVALLWGIFGNVPTKVMGQGILIRGGSVYAVEAGTNGQVVEMRFGPGDMVQKDQVVAEIAQTDTLIKLQNAKAALADKDRQNEVQTRRENEIAETGLAASRDERTTTTDAIRALHRQVASLEEVSRDQEELYAKGLLAKGKYLDIKTQLESTRVKLADTQTNLTRLTTQENQLENERQTKANARRQEIDDLRRDVVRLESQLQSSTQVVSQYTGRVIEKTVDRGNLVQANDPVLILEPVSEQVQAVMFIPPADGKRVKTGMEVRIAPSTVKPEEFGFIVGKVESISSYPSSPIAMKRVLRNDTLVRNLSASNSPIEVVATLEADGQTESGYRWSSSKGPPVKIFSGTLCFSAIVVERRRPIALVIPLFKKTLGLSS